MDAGITGSLVFIDDVSAYRRSRMYCEAYREYSLLRFSQSALELIRRCFQCTVLSADGKESKSFLKQRHEIFLNGQIRAQPSRAWFSVTDEDKTESRESHKQTAAKDGRSEGLHAFAAVKMWVVV